VITGSVIAVVLVAVGSTLIYLETAQQNGSTNVTTSKAPASGQPGYNIGGEISGAFSAIHNAIVPTDTVTTTEQITTETTTTTTLVSRTTQFSTLTQTSSTTQFSTVTQTSSTTQFSTLTQTSVVTLTSTVSGSAVPTNVTLLFTDISGNYTYSIQAGSLSTSGKTGNSPYSLQLTGPFQGQTITVTVATARAGGCITGEHLTLQLWINGKMVAQTGTFCGDEANGAKIVYTV
jgi:Flp pilus assembly pilin Flp